MTVHCVTCERGADAHGSISSSLARYHEIISDFQCTNGFCRRQPCSTSAKLFIHSVFNYDSHAETNNRTISAVENSSNHQMQAHVTRKIPHPWNTIYITTVVSPSQQSAFLETGKMHSFSHDRLKTTLITVDVWRSTENQISPDILASSIAVASLHAFTIVIRPSSIDCTSTHVASPLTVGVTDGRDDILAATATTSAVCVSAALLDVQLLQSVCVDALHVLFGGEASTAVVDLTCTARTDLPDEWRNGRSTFSGSLIRGTVLVCGTSYRRTSSRPVEVPPPLTCISSVYVCLVERTTNKKKSVV